MSAVAAPTRRGYVYKSMNQLLKLNYRKEMNCLEEAFHWNPCEELLADSKPYDYAVVILNTPIKFKTNEYFLLNLWENAKIRVTVDGGTKRWLSYLEELEKKGIKLRDIPTPDLITGDMDSLPQETLSHFEGTNTKIIKTPDQSETDYTKALKEIGIYSSMHNITIQTVYVFADTCGRVDHIMGNINTLFKLKKSQPQIRIFQIATTSLTWLLQKGLHKIDIPQPLRDKQKWCALVPIGSPCVVTTSGLKWNLENGRLEYGGMVSTSNTYDGSPTVTVQTDNTLVWLMGIDTIL